jgi:hypothetical protein
MPSIKHITFNHFNPKHTAFIKALKYKPYKPATLKTTSRINLIPNPPSNIGDIASNTSLLVNSFKEELALSLAIDDYKLKKRAIYTYFPEIYKVIAVTNLQDDTVKEQSKNSKKPQEKNKLPPVNALVLYRLNKYNNELLNTIDMISGLIDILT